MNHATPLAITRDYHQQTKHHFSGYARSPGYLDWDTQPDPFRTFNDSDLLILPLTGIEPTTRYADLCLPNTVPPAEPNLAALATLLRLAFGLSAWKATPDSRWSLRCNPSSGNLHPTEAYVVAGSGQAIGPGVYHYRPYDHALECRAEVSLPVPGLFIGLSSVYWREAWKYGERAFRYCQHDIGHALGALRLAAGVLGWRARVLDDWAMMTSNACWGWIVARILPRPNGRRRTCCAGWAPTLMGRSISTQSSPRCPPPAGGAGR